MKKWFFILIVFCTVSGFSAESAKIYLWPNAVPGESRPKGQPVPTPDRGDDVIRLTDISNPVLHVFTPDPANANGAAVIICPGGGYEYVAINKEGYEVAEWLNTLGYTAFVLQYRTPQKQDGAFMDIQRAIRLVRSKAKYFNIDTDKVGAMGFSAGGHLAAMAATQFPQHAYAAIDDADALSCRPDFAMLIYAAYLDGSYDNYPEVTIPENTPPMFLFATADDKHSSSTLAMAAALRDAGIAVEQHLLASGGHGYGLRKGNRAAEMWPVLTEKWLAGIVPPAEKVEAIPPEILQAAPENLIRLMNELAAQESNSLLKRHFQSVALFTADTTHGFQITKKNQEQAFHVLQFFQDNGANWQTYANGPRPLIMSFQSPTDGKYTFYKLFLPKDFDPDKNDYPFYIELHGSGGGNNDNPRKQLYESLQPEIKGVTSQGYRQEGLYIYPWGRGDKWYKGIAETDVLEVLADFDAMFNTDPRRQYLYGFSMGGGGSFRFAQKTIDRWSAVGLYSAAIFNLQADEAEKFKNIPVSMAWGELEERLAPVNRQLKDQFLQAGVDLKWVEIKDEKHKYLGDYQEDLMQWFLTKVKN